MTTDEEIQEIAQELRGRRSRKSEFEAAHSPMGDQNEFESEAHHTRHALSLTEELLKELNSPASRARERECLRLAGWLLQARITINWPATLHPTSGRPLPAGKWQTQFEATKARLRNKLAEQMRNESSSPKLRLRLAYLLQRVQR